MKSYRLTDRNFSRFNLNLGNLIEYYKEKYSVSNERDWKLYEKEYRNCLETAAREIRPIINGVISAMSNNIKQIGSPPKVSLEDKVMRLLLKDISDTSNRKTAR